MFTEISKIIVLAKRVIKKWRFKPSKIIKKTIKNWYTSLSVCWLIFWWIFGPCWPHVGPQDPPKIYQNPFKNHFKKLLFVYWIYVDLCSIWWILKLKTLPKAVSQFSRGGLVEGLGASWGQDNPKSPPNSPPRASQEPPRALQESLWDRFVVDF